MSSAPSAPILAESIFIPLDISTRLHLRHLQGSADGPVALLLHGSIENGKIFYSDSGKGLGWFLARAGYDVYIADLRGRGLSSPPIAAGSEAGLSEAIAEDMPAFMAELERRRPGAPITWIAHSWGGVTLSAALARHPDWLARISSIVLFGSKRTVRVRNREQRIKIAAFWHRAAYALTALYGYLPARELGIGSDNETRKSHRQTDAWAHSDSWTDEADGFDYAGALKARPYPRSLWLAGPIDYSLGHPSDVKDLMREVGAADADYWLLAKSEGFANDYGHIDMLTHADGDKDIFPKVLAWLKAPSA